MQSGCGGPAGYSNGVTALLVSLHHGMTIVLPL